MRAPGEAAHLGKPLLASDERARERVMAWFASRGWEAFDFQKRTWDAYAQGRSGLVHAPTGMGKSLAVWMGPVIESIAQTIERERAGAEGGENNAKAAKPRGKRSRDDAERIRVLWVTPMRALASDTAKSLMLPIEEMDLAWSVEKRTGDTTQSQRAKQRDKLPTCLVTTPESLTLLLSYPGARERFATLRCIVVDEWHELLSTKRGTQTELALARLRTWTPGVRTWGLSATLGNLPRALEVLVGARREETPPPLLVPGDTQKQVRVATVLPDSAERFPWAGHLGLKLLEKVIERIEPVGTSLLFTNTRSQAELWFRAITDARPDWLGLIGIHHGSLDRDVREEVEARLRSGALKCVVCTSSLDLGVDFSPVERVMQVGSPKGVARLLQRAGRSGHQPGAVSEVVCVPTNAMELVEFAAARRAIDSGKIESREPLDRPLDVLAQHLVTMGLAGGFDEDAMLAEVRSAWAYRALTDGEWRWVMEFVTTGGPTLRAYPQYARLAAETGSRAFRVATPAIERMHRLGIGTITSDASVRIAYASGRTLGTIEEGFIARLKPKDKFVFGGQMLELVRVRQMTAQVVKAKGGSAVVPRWDGGRTPLSTQLAHAVRAQIDDARAAIEAHAQRDEHAGERTSAGVFASPEMAAARPLLELQARWSRLPEPDELLVEVVETRDGHHVFLFPFEGRLVHEGVGALVAHRLARLSPRTVSVTPNDAGMELLSPTALPDDESTWRALLTTDHLVDDLMSCLNSTELTRRQFRDIARVAGLILPSYPGQAKTARQLQASSELFFEVFSEFDPGNMLLDQARREVLEQQLELGRLRQTLERLSRQRMVFVRPGRLTPFSFALWAEGLRTQQVTSEKWSDRVNRMVALLEREATDERASGRSRERDGTGSEGDQYRVVGRRGGSRKNSGRAGNEGGDGRAAR